MTEMSCLTSSTPDRYSSRRSLRKSETRPVWHKWRFVLELHMSGRSISDIEELTGYAKPTIYKILASDDVKRLRQQIMSMYDQEFEALYGKTIEAVREGLDHVDTKIKLDAAKLYLKAHGKGGGGDVNVTNVTAEDVVYQIINGGQAVGRAGDGKE